MLHEVLKIRILSLPFLPRLFSYSTMILTASLSLTCTNSKHYSHICISLIPSCPFDFTSFHTPVLLLLCSSFLFPSNQCPLSFAMHNQIMLPPTLLFLNQKQQILQIPSQFRRTQHKTLNLGHHLCRSLLQLYQSIHAL